MADFIGEYYLKDVALCDEIINYHKNNEDKLVGKTSIGYAPDQKKSTDVILDYKSDTANKYLKELQVILDQYIIEYPFCNSYAPFSTVETINIQQYKPNEGYYAWHCERPNNVCPVRARHLVFMTYLNDITDNGETEFYHQNIKVIPEKGKTLIWPADWTFTHRGVTSPTQEKYIITGWFSFTK